MIDLHCHSTASDGTLPPEYLPGLALQEGLKAVALTDHDTAGGIGPFLDAAKNTPEILCIPGIELSGNLANGENCHIVGLFIQHDHPALKALCDQVVQWRIQRNHAIAEKINALGMALDYDAIQRDHPGTIIGRPHLAEALVKAGYYKSIQDVFEKCIGRGRPGYVPRQVPQADLCIRIIHDAGGIAIWAHPFSNASMTQPKCLQRATELTEYGLDGIEAYYPEHSKNQKDNVIRIAQTLKLAVSGGSDFHGEHHPLIRLGKGYGTLCVPDCCLDGLQQKLSQRRHGGK